MRLVEFYVQIKAVHVAAVILSGSLFALRGALRIGNLAWANHPALRYLSYVIDTTLLAAALLLVAIVHQYPFVQAWLTAKVLLLVVYIGLGTFALKRGRSPAVRATCYALALAVFLFIVSIARVHDPRGIFVGLLS